MVEVPAAEKSLALAVRDGRQHMDAPIYAYHGIIGMGEGIDFMLEGYRQKDFALAHEPSTIAHAPVGEVVRQSRLAVKRNALEAPRQRLERTDRTADGPRGRRADAA
jgi:hypothetical protein